MQRVGPLIQVGDVDPEPESRHLPLGIDREELVDLGDGRARELDLYAVPYRVADLLDPQLGTPAEGEFQVAVGAGSGSLQLEEKDLAGPRGDAVVVMTFAG